MNQYSDHGWTDARVGLLAKLRAEGLSFRIIAARLGVTRSSALGKADRLGLPKLTKHAQRICNKKKGLRKPKPWRHKQAFGLIGKHTPPRLVADGFVPPADECIPLEQRKTIATLEDGDCRWPVGDPQLAGFHFCGAEKVEGLPYCEVHCRRAYAPPQPRRRIYVLEKVKETENI